METGILQPAVFFEPYKSNDCALLQCVQYVEKGKIFSGI